MYTEADYQSIRMQIKKRGLLLAIPVAILIAAFLYQFICYMKRDPFHQWIIYAAPLLAGLMIIFIDGLFIAPLRSYKRHLNDVLHGRLREMDCLFKAIDSTPCVRSGVSFYPVIVSAGSISNDEDDRLLYFDACLAFPAISCGDAVHITYHDKSIASIARC